MLGRPPLPAAEPEPEPEPDDQGTQPDELDPEPLTPQEVS
jgi:hypothetical protein